MFADNAISGDVLPYLTRSQLREMEAQIDPAKRISDADMDRSHTVFMKKKQDWVNSLT